MSGRIVDLHAHYPMQVIPPEHRGAYRQMRRWEQERWRARLIKAISWFANFEGADGTPSVTFEGMTKGRVGIILSVLYSPLDEINLDYGSPPQAGYVQSVLDQIRAVEESIPAQPGGEQVLVVKTPVQLEQAARGEKLGLVHCVEGGFALGPTGDDVRRSVAELAGKGVAYVTLAHLFWRRVATNAPALPFLPDWAYRLFFGQPDEGLSELGRVAAEAMIEKRVLIDASHMSDRSLEDALAIVERHPGTPLVATHGAFRFGYARGGLEYNYSPEQVERIAASGGVIGLIMCTHYISHGLYPPEELEHSLDLLCAHIDQIAEWSGWSFDHVAIGSDLDGFIKPALPGLNRLEDMGALQDRLLRRYGAENAAKICSGNALRLLRYRFGG
jgi:microsomal dipeptidase-like Zn-dependent dipeptidase